MHNCPLTRERNQATLSLLGRICWEENVTHTVFSLDVRMAVSAHFNIHDDLGTVLCEVDNVFLNELPEGNGEWYGRSVSAGLMAALIYFA